jgi:hypothetical protein
MSKTDEEIARLREKARVQAADVSRKQAAEADALKIAQRQLARSQVGDWKRAIEAAMKNGEVEVSAYRDGVRLWKDGWFGRLRMTRIGISGIAKAFEYGTDSYVDELRELLGPPFRVHYLSGGNDYTSSLITGDRIEVRWGAILKINGIPIES